MCPQVSSVLRFCEPVPLSALEYPALLLGLEPTDLSRGLVGHLMESNWGKDRYSVLTATGARTGPYSNRGKDR